MASILREKLGVERYFNIQNFTFNAIGFDIKMTGTFWNSYWKTFSTGFCLLITMICIAHYTLLYANEVDEVADALTPFLQATLSILKVMIFCYNHNDMMILIKRIWLMTMRANFDELHIIATENKREIRLCRLYSIAVFVTAVAAIGIPAIQYFYVYIFKRETLENADPFALIPFKASYPFDPLRPINYCLVALSSACGVVFLTCGSVAVDSLYCWYIYNILAQFRLLCQRFRIAALEDDVIVLERSIRKCIYMHQRVIEFCQELNRVFSFIIFVEFVVNCLQVCFLAYQLGRGVSLENVPFLVLFLVAVALQLLIYCYCGQRIQNESLQVAETIYCCFPWHNMSVSTKKLLMLSLLRAQHCCYLKGFFFVVDLRLFLLVFRTAASYVSLLWSLDD